VTTFEARHIRVPNLRFDPSIPSRVDRRAYQGLRAHGPFDSSRVELGEKSVLFVFPESLRDLARRLATALRHGHKNFPGFSAMFRTPFTGQHMDYLEIPGSVTEPAELGARYGSAIAEWNERSGTSGLQLALVLIPRTERWETDSAYYAAKATFARLGLPTQMVTAELLEDEREFGWSVANIALASFAKLGGIPWTVEAPADESDLVLGVGRADVGSGRRIFGYAVALTSNGLYRNIWGAHPVGDEEEYISRLEDVLVRALAEDVDQPFGRLVVHLARRTGWREIEAVRRAMGRAGVTLPTAFVRVDDSTLWDVASGAADHYAPPKGIAVRLGSRRALLQAEELTAIGPPGGPLLIELDGRSDIGSDELDAVVDQAYRLGYANWRGFNAVSRPVTIAYGEILARLVGYLEEVDSWDPSLLRNDLRERPWFL